MCHQPEPIEHIDGGDDIGNPTLFRPRQIDREASIGVYYISHEGADGADDEDDEHDCPGYECALSGKRFDNGV